MGTREQPPEDIGQRSFRYALKAIAFYRQIPRRGDGAARTIGLPYLRASTSIGANIVEARAAESRADFVHKFGTARKEAKESVYWLRLLAGVLRTVPPISHPLPASAF